MSLTATQTLGTGAAIKSEAAGTCSREQVTIPSGVGLVRANTVLGRYTSGANTGKVDLYDNDATDGRQTVYGVLLADTDATSADARGIAFVRDCEVWTERLVWGAAVTTQAAKDAAYLEMAAAGIVLC